MLQAPSRPRRSPASRSLTFTGLALAIASVLAGATIQTVGAQESQDTSDKKAVRPMVLGVSMQPDRSQAVYDGFVEQVGRPPAIWSFWSDWGALDADGC